jgi:hypothetical protein
MFIEKCGSPRLKENVNGYESAVEAIPGQRYYDKHTGKFLLLLLPDYSHHQGFDLINEIKFSENQRMSGLYYSGEIFGFAPREEVKRHPCRAVKFNGKYKKQYSFLKYESLKITETIKDKLPEVWSSHQNGFLKIASPWTMSGSAFTSGVINNSTQLMFHTDNGNMAGCISGMLSYKKGIDGGDLYLPEYNIIVKNTNNSLLLFDGANTSHGVTPFRRLNPGAKRYTVVFYVMDRLTKCCKDANTEIEYFNNRLTENLLKK